jgi:hypothetical protein
MNLIQNNLRTFAIVSIIVFGALMRFIPHWPNFTPIAAIALFGGAYLSRKYIAFVVTLGAMLLSDLVIGFHGSIWAVYLAFTITILIGMRLSRKITTGNVIVSALGSSILFFLITNFAAWLTWGFYPQNFIGLMQSYVAGLVFFNDGNMGISFFLNEVIGTLFYSGLFFGAFALAEKRFPVLRRA